MRGCWFNRVRRLAFAWIFLTFWCIGWIIIAIPGSVLLYLADEIE